MYRGGDLATVVGWGIGKGDRLWKLAHFWHEILDLAKSLDISFVHVLREQNSLADKLANWGVGMSSNLNGS